MREKRDGSRVIRCRARQSETRARARAPARANELVVARLLRLMPATDGRCARVQSFSFLFSSSFVKTAEGRRRRRRAAPPAKDRLSEITIGPCALPCLIALIANKRYRDAIRSFSIETQARRGEAKVQTRIKSRIFDYLMQCPSMLGKCAEIILRVI